MTDSNYARLDAEDKLASIRQQFLLPPDTIYLDGNSLGPLPAAVPDRARDVVQVQWGHDLIKSWNKHQWIDLPRRVGEKIAPLLGAGPGQVICCDSISINLFKLLAVALQRNAGRQVILSQRDNFPTDLYVGQGLSGLLGPDRCRLQTVEGDELLQALDESVAVLLLSQVNFRSGELHDIAEITAAAHDKGILVIWDLAHSAGVIPLELDTWQVDFAVGCGYKFLNGGPGAPAFIYANQRHHENLQQPLQGWMGHRAPFEFSPDYEAASGIEQFLAGTPPVLSMAVLDAALDVFAGLRMEDLRHKSLALSQLFMDLVADSPELQVLELQTPVEDSRRGSQLAFAHEEAYGICQALIQEKVIADFRSPNLLRMGFSPLILRYADVVRAVEVLRDVVQEKRFLAPENQARQKVT